MIAIPQCGIKLLTLEKKEIIDRILGDWKVPAASSKDEAWNKLQSKIEDSSSTTRVIPIGRRVARVVAVAAAVALLFVVFSSDSKMITHKTLAEASQEALLLPDGSKVWLNVDSEISFDEANWEEERKIVLDGEGYFEVVKGEKFVVETSHGDVAVLGTSFNIFERADYFEVDCFTGKVQVSNENDQVVLTKGLSSQMNGKKFKKRKSTMRNPDWKGGEFVFDNQEIKRVFKELEAQFGVTIKSAELGDKIFTGSFKAENIESALSTVCLPLGLTYEVIDAKTFMVKLK